VTPCRPLANVSHSSAHNRMHGGVGFCGLALLRTRGFQPRAFREEQ
jgi:hypothetical protein